MEINHQLGSSNHKDKKTHNESQRRQIIKINKNQHKKGKASIDKSFKSASAKMENFGKRLKSGRNKKRVSIKNSPTFKSKHLKYMKPFKPRLGSSNSRIKKFIKNLNKETYLGELSRNPVSECQTDRVEYKKWKNDSKESLNFPARSSRKILGGAPEKKGKSTQQAQGIKSKKIKLPGTAGNTIIHEAGTGRGGKKHTTARVLNWGFVTSSSPNRLKKNTKNYKSFEKILKKERSFLSSKRLKVKKEEETERQTAEAKLKTGAGGGGQSRTASGASKKYQGVDWGSRLNPRFKKASGGRMRKPSGHIQPQTSKRGPSEGSEHHKDSNTASNQPRKKGLLQLSFQLENLASQGSYQNHNKNEKDGNRETNQSQGNANQSNKFSSSNNKSLARGSNKTSGINSHSKEVANEIKLRFVSKNSRKNSNFSFKKPKKNFSSSKKIYQFSGGSGQHKDLTPGKKAPGRSTQHHKDKKFHSFAANHDIGQNSQNQALNTTANAPSQLKGYRRTLSKQRNKRKLESFLHSKVSRKTEDRKRKNDPSYKTSKKGNSSITASRSISYSFHLGTGWTRPGGYQPKAKITDFNKYKGRGKTGGVKRDGQSNGRRQKNPYRTYAGGLRQAVQNRVKRDSRSSGGGAKAGKSSDNKDNSTKWRFSGKKLNLSEKLTWKSFDQQNTKTGNKYSKRGKSGASGRGFSHLTERFQRLGSQDQERVSRQKSSLLQHYSINSDRLESRNLISDQKRGQSLEAGNQPDQLAEGSIQEYMSYIMNQCGQESIEAANNGIPIAKVSQIFESRYPDLGDYSSLMLLKFGVEGPRLIQITDLYLLMNIFEILIFNLEGEGELGEAGASARNLAHDIWREVQVELRRFKTFMKAEGGQGQDLHNSALTDNEYRLTPSKGHPRTKKGSETAKNKKLQSIKVSKIFLSKKLNFTFKKIKETISEFSELKKLKEETEALEQPQTTCQRLKSKLMKFLNPSRRKDPETGQQMITKSSVFNQSDEPDVCSNNLTEDKRNRSYSVIRDSGESRIEQISKIKKIDFSKLKKPASNSLSKISTSRKSKELSSSWLRQKNQLKQPKDNGNDLGGIGVVPGNSGNTESNGAFHKGHKPQKSQKMADLEAKCRNRYEPPPDDKARGAHSNKLNSMSTHTLQHVEASNDQIFIKKATKSSISEKRKKSETQQIQDTKSTQNQPLITLEDPNARIDASVVIKEVKFSSMESDRYHKEKREETEEGRGYSPEDFRSKVKEYEMLADQGSEDQGGDESSEADFDQIPAELFKEVEQVLIIGADNEEGGLVKAGGGRFLNKPALEDPSLNHWFDVSGSLLEQRGDSEEALGRFAVNASYDAAESSGRVLRSQTFQKGGSEKTMMLKRHLTGK